MSFGLRDELLRFYSDTPLSFGSYPGDTEVAVNLNGIDLGGSAATGSARNSASAQNAPASSQDAKQQSHGEVSITSTASLLARLQQSLGGTPAFDQAKVDAISKALADGKYSVNPGKIAHGLTQIEQALGRLNRQGG
jgi:flagellar biosynthesis anti-sigma factor FlgM